MCKRSASQAVLTRSPNPRVPRLPMSSAEAYTQRGSPTAASRDRWDIPRPTHPRADTQSFQSEAALAGSPVQVVPVPIAAKWLLSGAETAGPLRRPLCRRLDFCDFERNFRQFANIHQWLDLWNYLGHSGWPGVYRERSDPGPVSGSVGTGRRAGDSHRRCVFQRCCAGSEFRDRVHRFAAGRQCCS